MNAVARIRNGQNIRHPKNKSNMLQDKPITSCLSRFDCGALLIHSAPVAQQWAIRRARTWSISSDRWQQQQRRRRRGNWGANSDCVTTSNHDKISKIQSVQNKYHFGCGPRMRSSSCCRFRSSRCSSSSRRCSSRRRDTSTSYGDETRVVDGIPAARKYKHVQSAAKNFQHLKRYYFLKYECRNILLTQHWNTFIREFENCR